MSDRTPAEAYYDAVVAERRAKGRETYGRGLTHTDDYDWNQMALEEAMDLSQYLAAENLRQREEIERLRAENQRLTAERDALKIAAGFLPVTFRERIYAGDQIRALEWREQSAFFVKTIQEQRDAAERRATTAESALPALRERCAEALQERVHEATTRWVRADADERCDTDSAIRLHVVAKTWSEAEAVIRAALSPAQAGVEGQ